MEKITIQLTKDQVQSVLNSLVQSYYKLDEISKRAEEINKKDWEGVVNEKLNLIDFIEESTKVKTFGANSFRAVL